MTFVDTSALYALADRADPNHARGRNALASLLREGCGLLTHNYVLVESIALIHHRLGLQAALKLAASTHLFEVEWIDERRHGEAVRRLAGSSRRRCSLVDRVSFLVMRDRGVDTAFAFDDDFRREGFRLLGQ